MPRRRREIESFSGVKLLDMPLTDTKQSSTRSECLLRAYECLKPFGVMSPERQQRNDWQAGFSRRSWGEFDSTNPFGPRLPFLQTHCLVRSGAAPATVRAARLACLLSSSGVPKCGDARMGWCLPTKSLTKCHYGVLRYSTYARSQPRLNIGLSFARCQAVGLAASLWTAPVTHPSSMHVFVPAA